MQYEMDKNSKRILKSMLDDFSQKFRYKFKRSTNYVNTMNEVIAQMDTVPPSTLATITSHKFYITIRNLTRDLLIDWHSNYKLNQNETFLLRNCVLLLNRLVNVVEDVTVLTSWLLDPLLINVIADCMSDIDQLLFKDKEKRNFKQLTRLLDLFITYYQRLPSNLQNNDELDPLFEATMDCLVSSKYDQTFRKLKVNAKSMTTKQKFFLIKCPCFLISKHGTQSKKIIEQLLETMIPRYASVLDKHIKSIKEWHSPIIHAVHYLLLTVVSIKGYYTPYANGQPFQWLIDHIVRIISESTIVNKVDENSITPETILIDSALKTLTAFVHEPDLLAYMKKLKITSIFRSLILLSYESIVFHAYIMLSYTMDEDDIKASEKDSGRLLSNILDSLRKKIQSLTKTSKNEEFIQNNIALLAEAVQVLVQHDQIKIEILKQNALSLLINNWQHFDDRSKRLILESLGSMTFNDEAARLLREDTQFISSVEDIEKTTNVGINKAAEKIIWNLIKEPEKVAEREKKTKENIESDDKKKQKSKQDKYQHDIMISYCHADKELVYRIQKFLADKGFKIWFDRDNMYGPAMQAMADAVENSEFVILCISDSYKLSVYCQAEAEYAFRCKRRLLPLIVRQGYRPDGWLGLLMGSRIYVDFGRLEFKKACELLLNEIILQRKSQVNVNTTNRHTLDNGEIDLMKPALSDEQAQLKSTAIPTVVDQVNLSQEYMNRNTKHSTYRSISLYKWTKKDVLDFLFDSKLHLMMPLCESMTGHGLNKLFRICQAKPSRFHSQLNEELHSRFNGLCLPIGIFTQFLSEIEQLTDSLSQSHTQNIEHTVSELKSTSPSSPSSIMAQIVKNISVPSSPVESSSIPSSHETTSSTLPKMQIPGNIPVIQQTADRPESIVDSSPHLTVKSSSITQKSIEPELLFIDERAR